MNQIPRPEYPRPQMVRDAWLNLNGEWDFEFDFGKSGWDRSFYKPENAANFSKKILVPFCPESKLSGIGYVDFIPAVWYSRTFEVPASWSGKNLLLHFGAADYKTTVWVNGVNVGTHTGGYSSFSFDITKALCTGTNTIVVYCEDDVRSGKQPRGKQCGGYYSAGCDYTRTTGIWQTVWLEAVTQRHIRSCKYITDPDNAVVRIEARLEGQCTGMSVLAVASYEGREVGRCQAKVSTFNGFMDLPVSEVHLWEVGHGRLYDLELTLLNENGEAEDAVKSYFGMRTVALKDMAILINHKPVFQRLVLDQGFYPDGIYTAPDDAALINDIEISMGLGFNGARLHEKIFEPRFLYHADRLGYIVWGEHANWGLNITETHGLFAFLPEWLEALERDFNHPAIVGWCPFNETWDYGGRRQINDVLKIVYDATKAVDGTRPVIDTSGNFHVVTDIFDVHNYNQNPEEFRKTFEGSASGTDFWYDFKDRMHYDGQPYFVSEYGGIKWCVDEGEGWGYGESVKSEAEFLERYEKLTDVLLENPNMCAFCYTQLYDVEQEKNGLYTYDRKPKFDPALIQKCNSKKAAIEK